MARSSDGVITALSAELVAQKLQLLIRFDGTIDYINRIGFL